MNLMILTIMASVSLFSFVFGGEVSVRNQGKEMLNCCTYSVATAAMTKTEPAISVSNLGFDVIITLSEKAAVELAKEHAKVIVFASYYGEPKKNARKKTNEVGLIDLSSAVEKINGSTGGHVHVSGVKVDPVAIDWVSGPIKVNVNVASESRSNSQNLLDCDFIDGTLSFVQEQAPVLLNCYLIDESHSDTRLRP